MPWVRLDDRFASHRKVALLSDRAFRLYISALCWASENLTEGKILDRELSVVARVRGLKAAAAELQQAGLWDRVEDGWQIHDYLDYNPDRAKIQAEREANAARQQAFRDRKKAARDAARNAVTDDSPKQQNSTTTTASRHDGDTNAREEHLANQSSSQASEFRNAVSNGTPNPSRPVVPPEEEQQLDWNDGAGDLPRIGDRPRIPPNCLPLVQKLTAARLIVGWDLQPGEWFTVEALIKRCGIDALVVSATGSWQGAKVQPRSGTYFIPAWRKLFDSVEPEQPSLLPAVGGAVHAFPDPGQHRPATTDVRANQAIEAGRRLQAIRDAQRTQESS
jgi:hypothetical protein